MMYLTSEVIKSFGGVDGTYRKNRRFPSVRLWVAAQKHEKNRYR